MHQQNHAQNIRCEVADNTNMNLHCAPKNIAVAAQGAVCGLKATQAPTESTVQNEQHLQVKLTKKHQLASYLSRSV